VCVCVRARVCVCVLCVCNHHFCTIRRRRAGPASEVNKRVSSAIFLIDFEFINHTNKRGNC